MKKDQPVLVILTPGFPENEKDSTCLPFAQNLVRSIKRDFPNVTIIILAFQYPYVAAEYLWYHNLVISLGGKGKGKISRRMIWLRAWRKLVQLHRDNSQMGLLSLWLGECAWVGSHFGRWHKIRHFCWIAGQDAGPDNPYVRKINPGPESLIAISDFVADEFFKNYLIRPLHIIPNGIVKGLFETVSYKRTIDVMGAGSLIPLKQYDQFISCIAQLKFVIPGIYSIIAGKGQQWRELFEIIRGQELSENVVLKGEMEHRDLLRLMQQSKVFLHPSRYEGFSMACLEALFAGCHVISFCRPMMVGFKHWHIVGNPDEMKEKVREILTNPDIEFESVMPYSISETGRSFMNLFGY